MKKLGLTLVMAMMAVMLVAGGVWAMGYPYWTITSTDAEFYMDNPDAVIEFGLYTVDDITNPDAATVGLTCLFEAGADHVQVNGVSVPAFAQINAGDYDVFGFYVKNTNNNRIWLSDDTIVNSTSGELVGLHVRNDTDRFIATALTGTDQWNFAFTKLDGSTVRWDATGDDIAPVPEPSTMALLGIGLLGLAFVGRRKLKIEE